MRVTRSSRPGCPWERRVWQAHRGVTDGEYVSTARHLRLRYAANSSFRELECSLLFHWRSLACLVRQQKSPNIAILQGFLKAL